MRKREHAFILRLNNDEMYHLKRQVEKSGLSREVYMRKLIMCKEIRERPQRDCVELLREVRRALPVVCLSHGQCAQRWEQ